MRNNLKWNLKILLGKNLFVYKLFIKYIAKRKNLFVVPETDIVIEGFPRSGNTFAVALFKVTQKKNINIACHRHEIGHIKLALNLKKPIIVLIRNPEDAVISLYLRENVNLSTGFKYYIDFYKNLLKPNIYRKILFINFNNLINDPINLLKKTSKKFNIDLEIPQKIDIEEIKNKVISMDMDEFKNTTKNKNIDLRISLPTNSKKLIKNSIKKDIRDSKKLYSLLSEANEVYKEIITKKNE